MGGGEELVVEEMRTVEKREEEGEREREQPIKAADCFGREEENTKSGHGKKDEEEEMERLV